MDPIQFQAMRKAFQKSSIDDKILLYISARGLTQAQYKELLRLFPMDAFPRLEAAMYPSGSHGN